MTAFVYLGCAVLFARWIISREEDPDIMFNAFAALISALEFITAVIGVMILCGYVM